MSELLDATGVSQKLDDDPRRVVSLVPSTTETVYQIGAEERLVGVTRFCERPERARRDCAVIGGTKSPRIDAILELEPDLVLANKEENRLEDVERLRASTAVHVFYPRNVPEAVADIETLARRLDREVAGERLSRDIESARKRLQKSPTFRFLYFIWRRPYMVAGADTFIDALLSEAGGINAAPARGRYPELTLEEIERSRADVILLSSEPFPFEASHVEELSTHTKARIDLVDGQLLSWHGARLAEGLPYLERLKTTITGRRQRS